jgi:hypothetical protein
VAKPTCSTVPCVLFLKFEVVERRMPTKEHQNSMIIITLLDYTHIHLSPIYLSIHGSGSMKVVFEMSINWFEGKTGNSPERSPQFLTHVQRCLSRWTFIVQLSSPVTADCKSHSIYH